MAVSGAMAARETRRPVACLPERLSWPSRATRVGPHAGPLPASSRRPPLPSLFPLRSFLRSGGHGGHVRVGSGLVSLLGSSGRPREHLPREPGVVAPSSAGCGELKVRRPGWRSVWQAGVLQTRYVSSVSHSSSNARLFSVEGVSRERSKDRVLVLMELSCKVK